MVSTARCVEEAGLLEPRVEPDPVAEALRAAPLDDEPETEEEMRVSTSPRRLSASTPGVWSGLDQRDLLLSLQALR
jgi:hypothetical protein